jgi:hypothetical protein
MVVSAGNLDGLVGISFGASQLVGVSVFSYAQAADGSVVDLLTEVLSTPSTLAQGGAVSYTIASVNDATDQIALDQFGAAASGVQSFVATQTYNVLGYTSQAMIVSSLSLTGLVAALQAEQNVSGLVGVIAATSVEPGDLLAFSPSGTFTGTLPCFALGTRILTDDGEVRVEDVLPGDRVPCQLSGRTRRVRWVGRRTVDVAAHPRPWDVAPVRVRAHAFAPGQPRRDLLLSPDHAVLVDGALIPVRYLVNGVTVAREPADSVTYLHIELDTHDVLLAEGMPCESFLDTGNRAALAVPPPPLSRGLATLGARPRG